jgi:hypothetical protein
LRFARKRDLCDLAQLVEEAGADGDPFLHALLHCGSPAIMTGWAGSTGWR